MRVLSLVLLIAFGIGAALGGPLPDAVVLWGPRTQRVPLQRADSIPRVVGGVYGTRNVVRPGTVPTSGCERPAPDWESAASARVGSEGSARAQGDA